MKPTIGRIVTYLTTALDQRRINEHPHNIAQEQSPAIIVAVIDDETLSLKVFIDGWGDLYVKGSTQGDEAGQWHWPVIEFDDVDEIKPVDESLFKLDTILNSYLATEKSGTSIPEPGFYMEKGAMGEPGLGPTETLIANNRDFQNPLPPVTQPEKRDIDPASSGPDERGDEGDPYPRNGEKGDPGVPSTSATPFIELDQKTGKHKYVKAPEKK